MAQHDVARFRPQMIDGFSQERKREQKVQCTLDFVKQSIGCRGIVLGNIQPDRSEVVSGIVGS